MFAHWNPLNWRVYYPYEGKTLTVAILAQVVEQSVVVGFIRTKAYSRRFVRISVSRAVCVFIS